MISNPFNYSSSAYAVVEDNKESRSHGPSQEVVEADKGLLVSCEGALHQQLECPVLVLGDGEPPPRDLRPLVPSPPVQINPNEGQDSEDLEQRYGEGDNEQSVLPSVVGVVGLQVVAGLGLVIEEVSDADGPCQEEDVHQELHVDEEVDEGEGGGVRKVFAHDGLDGGIGDHKCGNVDDPVHDLSGLVEDVHADEGQKPEGDEDGHHIHHRKTIQGNLKDSVFEWFKGQLGGSHVRKQHLPFSLLLQVYGFPLVVGKGFHLGLHDIVLAEADEGGAGEHWSDGHQAVSRAQVGFLVWLLQVEVVKADPFDVGLAFFNVLQALLVHFLYSAVYRSDVLFLAVYRHSFLVLEGVDGHVVQGYSEIEVDEVEGGEELAGSTALDDLDEELLADDVEDSPTNHVFALLLIGHPRLEGLDLELFGACGGNLDCDVLIEGDREKVGGSLYLLLTVFLQGILLLRIPVKSLKEEVLQVVVVGKDEEADAEHPVDLGTQVLEVDFCEVLYLELDAGGYKQLVRLLLQMKHSKALLQRLNVELSLRVGLRMHAIRSMKLYYCDSLESFKLQFDNEQSLQSRPLPAEPIQSKPLRLRTALTRGHEPSLQQYYHVRAATPCPQLPCPTTTYSSLHRQKPQRTSLPPLRYSDPNRFDKEGWRSNVFVVLLPALANRSMLLPAILHRQLPGCPPHLREMQQRQANYPCQLSLMFVRYYCQLARIQLAFTPTVMPPIRCLSYNNQLDERGRRASRGVPQHALQRNQCQRSVQQQGPSCLT